MKIRTEYDEGGWDIDLYTVTKEDIDNLVKEMTEGEDEN
jgi:Holliday junction resolvase RusA-like endonuclease